MNFRFLVLLFLFPPCAGFSETLFEQFDLHKPIRSVDFSKSEDLKKQAKKHAEEENRLFKHEVLQKIKTGEHDVLLEKAFYSRNGIDRYRYSIKALNAKQEDIILWQMDYFTTSNRRFFGHLHYDESSGILRFASVRKDDVFYHPAIYEWEGARLVKRNIYSLSVLPDIKCDSLTYFEDQGFGYFCFSQKSGTAGKRDLFKLNTGDLQARLWPAGGIAGALCAFVPFELLLYYSAADNKSGDIPSMVESISVNGKIHTGIECTCPAFFADITINYRQCYELSKSYRYYLFAMAAAENEIVKSGRRTPPDKTHSASDAESILMRTRTWGETADSAKQYFRSEENQAAFEILLSRNAFFARCFSPGGHAVSKNEAKRFYDNYKWAFRKKFDGQSGYYSFDSVKNFIYAEIRRLKTFGLQKLIDNPPQVEIIWIKEEAPPAKRGFFDPLPPDELERRKREFLASQPLKELFTEMELKELFAEPDYTKITDPPELARAFDWAGKYPEALAALKKAQGPEAQFALACFLKHGRPGIPADTKKANELFAEIVSSVEAGSGSVPPEDLCLAGRAGSEYTPENWNETVRWKKRTAAFYQRAMDRGYRPAYYYSQYYLRHSSDNDPQKLLKALPSDNLEINAFIGALAGLNPRFKAQRNREENLAAVKAAVRAHSNVAQSMLGMLYLHSETDPNAFLRHNLRKAGFWLRRAAERGDTDALQMLQINPGLKEAGK